MAMMCFNVVFMSGGCTSFVCVLGHNVAFVSGGCISFIVVPWLQYASM